MAAMETRRRNPLLLAREISTPHCMAGFTTVQSVGGVEDLDLRDAVARWQIPGPRILTSITQLSNKNLSPDSLRTLVRSLKARGADVIKLFASAGLGAGGAQTLSDEQLAAICGEAKAQGLRSVVHAISAGSVRAATLAGCTEIEHGTFVTEAELTLMAQHGTIFDPQVCLVFQNYIDHRDVYARSGFSDSSFIALANAIPTATAMFRKAIATPGLKIIFGTDAVALAHGHNADELLCRVKAGQTPDGRDHVGDVGDGCRAWPGRQDRFDSARLRCRPDRRSRRSVAGHRGDHEGDVRDARRRGVHRNAVSASHGSRRAVYAANRSPVSGIVRRPHPSSRRSTTL